MYLALGSGVEIALTGNFLPFQQKTVIFKR
jgi:hypothetical protein